MQTRPSNTIGVARAVTSALQIRFSPWLDQEETSPFSSDTPLRKGPRQFGQSPAPTCDTMAAQRHGNATHAIRLFIAMDS
jgi:hypothetical protein